MNRSRTAFVLATTALLAAAFPVAAVIPEHVPCAGAEVCEEQIDPRATYALAYGIELESYLYAQAALYQSYADRVGQDTNGELGRVIENVNIMSGYATQVQQYLQTEFIPYVESLDDGAQEYAGELVDYGMVKKDDLAGFAYYAADFSGAMGSGLKYWVYVVDESDGAEIPEFPPFAPETYFAIPPEMPPAATDLVRPPPPPPALPTLYLPDAPEATPMPGAFPVPDFHLIDYDAQKADMERAAWEAASLASTQAEVSTTTVAAQGTAPPPPPNCTSSNLNANPNADFDNDGLSNAVERTLLAHYGGNALTFDPCNPNSDGDGIPDGLDAVAASNLPIHVRIQVKAIRQLQYMDCCDYWWGPGENVWGDPYLYGGVKWGTGGNNYQTGSLNWKGLRSDDEGHHHDEQTVTIEADAIEAGQDLFLDLASDINAWSHGPSVPTLHFEFALADHDTCVDDVYPSRGNTDGPCGANPSLAKELMQTMDKELFQIVYEASQSGEVYQGLKWVPHTLRYGDVAEVDLRITVMDMDLCSAARIQQVFSAIRNTGSFTSALTTAPSYC